MMITCRFFKSGNCREGNDCPLPHKKAGKPDRLCRFFLKGRCTYGARCHFLHQVYLPPPLPENHTAEVDREAASNFNNQIEQDALAKARASYMPPPPPEIEQDALAMARASYMPPPPPEIEQDALAKAGASNMPPPPPEIEQDALAKARASYMPPPPPEIPPFDLTLLGISQSCSSSAHDEKQYISIIPVYPTVPAFRPAWQRSALRWGDRAEQQKQNSFSTYPVLKLLRKPTTEEEDTPWEIDEDGKRYMYFVPIAPDALAPATYQCYKLYHRYQEHFTSSIVHDAFRKLLLQEFVSNKISLERPLEGPWQ